MKGLIYYCFIFKRYYYIHFPKYLIQWSQLLHNIDVNIIIFLKYMMQHALTALISLLIHFHLFNNDWDNKRSYWQNFLNNSNKQSIFDVLTQVQEVRMNKIIFFHKMSFTIINMNKF